MTELDKDLRDLLTASREAIDVLRRNAERLETLGLESGPERAAVRHLGMAVQLVEYDLTRQPGSDFTPPWDYREY